MPTDPVLVILAVLMLGDTATMACIAWQLRMDRLNRRQGQDVGLSIFDSWEEPVYVQPSPLLQQRIVGHLHRLDQAHRHAAVVVAHGPVTREFHRIIAAHTWEQPALIEVA